MAFSVAQKNAAVFQHDLREAKGGGCISFTHSKKTYIV